MTSRLHSDALVFFGATGDLAYRQIFPALQALVRRGALNGPVTGEMEPYERLLGDAMRGDTSLFGREDAIEEQWRIVDPVLHAETPPYPYEPGTWGPAEADRLVADVAGGWQRPLEPMGAS